MLEPITVPLSPNVFKKDLVLALKVLFSPQEWIEGRETFLLERDFEKVYPGTRAFAFVSGRTALLGLLTSLGIGPGDEVLLQSFTCVVVANSIIKLGARPIWVDVEKDSFNLDPADLEKKITPSSRAVIIQHTFGYPAKVQEIIKIAKKYRLKVIEDCAHGINIPLGKKKLGMFGDGAFFSFGRDKAISSVFGGMAIVSSPKLAKRMAVYQNSLPYPSRWWVTQQLLHPLIFSLLLPVYNLLSLGKVILVLSQSLKLLSRPVYEMEKKGIFPDFLVAKMPNGLAILARSQLARLDEFNLRRKKMTDFYVTHLKGLPIELPAYLVDGEVIPLLRFTVKTKTPQELYEYARSRGVLLNNWYYPTVSPVGVDLGAVGYDPNSCGAAERVSAMVVNLPTHPRMNMADAGRVVEVIKDFFKKR